MNGTLSFYECKFNGEIPWGSGDTQTLPYIMQKNLFELFTLGDTKTLGASGHARAIWWNFHDLYFSNMFHLDIGNVFSHVCLSVCL